MEINKHNYQIWISDYYDGSLSDSDIKVLHSFLDLNPDLRDEFNSYEELVLHPDISIRIDKDSLRKDLDSENTDAIEHCALALSENDLEPDLESEFKELTSHSEKAKSEATIYSSLKLVPDNTSYPDKVRLKRIPYRLGFAKTAIRVLAVAASLALIISLSVLLPREAENNFSYNTAYLLPFNSGEQLSESENRGHSSIINAGLAELKEIKLTERPAEVILPEQSTRQDIVVGESSYLNRVSLASISSPETLIAMKQAESVMPVNTKQDLSPRQFFAMNFRKHLLQEDVDNTDKLKVYEVADVSIDGLNKLLGWDMVFEKERTEDGRLASFKFTSQLLNLDHKSKKVAD